MSQINVNRIKDSNKGAPDFPSGVNVGGITSTVTLGVTNLNPTNLNVSGVVTATTLDGNLLATGTPTLGLGVTINTSGVNISGVATAGIVSATTLYGDGTNITGIAVTIAPLNYNPALNGLNVSRSSGIGLTFNQRVVAGSGNVTLRKTNGSGAVVQNWGVGSSITYAGNEASMSVDSTLTGNQLYHLSYPSGAFTNGDVSYVGTAYTFNTIPPDNELWSWGYFRFGSRGDNGPNVKQSSPVQLAGGKYFDRATVNYPFGVGIVDGTLWTWGYNLKGGIGDNSTTSRSSPTQVPGTTWSTAIVVDPSSVSVVATKTDGTLWGWGNNTYGEIGNNTTTLYSSPVQVGSDTTWNSTAGGIFGGNGTGAVKTDGTMWAWGYNGDGRLGHNNETNYSSPVQIPGTTWDAGLRKNSGTQSRAAIKTDGTLWVWGENSWGQLGINSRTLHSSPTQVPGTTWSKCSASGSIHMYLKTDNTLWVCGRNNDGELGINSKDDSRSSPVQIPGTTWSDIMIGKYHMAATKTDGTLWIWGDAEGKGYLGQNQSDAYYSSPVQIPGTDWTFDNVIGSSRNKTMTSVFKQI